MTETFYLRRATVQIGSVVVKHAGDEDLRIRFKVAKNPWATEPNRAHIEIYNLADSRREILDTLIARTRPVAGGPPAPRAQVTVEAGYAGNSNPGVGRIFKAPLMSVAHSRESGDWVTKILSSSISARDVPITATFSGPNTTVGSVAVDLLKKISKAAGDLDVTSAVSRALQGDLNGLEQTLNKAFSVSGMGMDVLEKLVSEHGFRISEQDGSIVLLKTDEKVGRSIVLNADSGLVGTIDPITDVRRPGVHLVRAKSLLRHDIRIGAAVQLDSVVQKGLFVAEEVEHHGDTHGGADGFVTSFKGRGVRKR